MNHLSIAILGGGNLGTSMALGFAASGKIEPAQIFVTRRNLSQIKHLEAHGISTTDNNLEAVRKAQVIILAVKPKHMAGLLQQIKPELNAQRHIVVSTATGVSLQEMAAEIGNAIPCFRSMPNTATAIRESITCIATNNGTEEQRALMSDLFDLLGKSLIIEEELFQAATVLGACGIAYALRFIRAMAQGGIEIGFSSETAHFIAAQTLKGASELLQQTGNHPEQEIDKVTTPQGCTITGLNEMEHRGFTSSLIKGIKVSYNSISDMKSE